MTDLDAIADSVLSRAEDGERGRGSGVSAAGEREGEECDETEEERGSRVGRHHDGRWYFETRRA